MKIFRAWWSDERPLIPLIIAFAWQLLFVVVPLALMVVIALFDRAQLSEFISLPYVWCMARSLGLSLTTVFLCTVCAYPLAYMIARSSKIMKYLMLFLLLLPFCTNFLLHILAWFFVLERGGFLNTMLLYFGFISEPIVFLNTQGAVIVMMLYYYLPFMTLPLYTSLERLDKRLIEASLDLGATWWQTVYKVIVPVTWSGYVSGFFLVLIPAFGEFAIPELMGGDRWYYSGSAISYTLLSRENPAAGILLTLCSAMALVIIGGVMRLLLRLLVRGVHDE